MGGGGNRELGEEINKIEEISEEILSVREILENIGFYNTVITVIEDDYALKYVYAYLSNIFDRMIEPFTSSINDIAENYVNLFEEEVRHSAFLINILALTPLFLPPQIHPHEFVINDLAYGMAPYYKVSTHIKHTINVTNCMLNKECNNKGNKFEEKCIFKVLQENMKGIKKDDFYKSLALVTGLLHDIGYAVIDKQLSYSISCIRMLRIFMEIMLQELENDKDCKPLIGDIKKVVDFVLKDVNISEVRRTSDLHPLWSACIVMNAFRPWENRQKAFFWGTVILAILSHKWLPWVLNKDNEIEGIVSSYLCIAEKLRECDEGSRQEKSS